MVRDFKHRLDQHIALDHHDIGFLYTLTAVAEWKITGSEAARAVGLQAADTLCKRWREPAGILQAWGLESDPENAGRIIIDCLMNLPLLFWAAEETGDRRYYEIALEHAFKSRKFLVRGDASSYHTFYFDPATGNAIRGEHIKVMRTDRPGHGVKLGEYTVLLWRIAIRRMRIFLRPLRA